jgi:hypothetical protein
VHLVLHGCASRSFRLLHGTSKTDTWSVFFGPACIPGRRNSRNQSYDSHQGKQYARVRGSVTRQGSRRQAFYFLWNGRALLQALSFDDIRPPTANPSHYCIATLLHWTSRPPFHRPERTYGRSGPKTLQTARFPLALELIMVQFAYLSHSPHGITNIQHFLWKLVDFAWR